MTHALLIDGENLSCAHAPRLLASVPADCAVRRVYGDTARLNGWQAVPHLRVVHVPPGGNAADIALAVDAVAFAHAEGFRSFTLATSDGGLATLARHLREAGRRVTVAGAAQTPATLRAAAHEFMELSEPLEIAASTTLVPPPPKRPLLPAPVALSPLEVFVLGLVSNAKDAGLPLTAINPQVHRSLKIRIADQPEKSWRVWLTARPTLFRTDPRGSDARVRLSAP